MTVSCADVKWIQVEATTKCNAWCPACARNTNGYGLAPDLKIQDLSVDRLQEILSLFPNLEVVHFCGTYGDAIAANNIKDMISMSKQYCKKIQLNTNGSLRTVDWWRELAIQLLDIDHDIWFCLDGLEDTHHIYRQGTNFQTIINNARAFINAGGQASWQFIPWAHNEHQITDCIRMSQQLGFKNFRFVKNARSDFNAKDYRTGESVHIVNWSKNNAHNRFAKVPERVEEKNCLHLSQPSVYLNADGTLSACCWINLHHTFDSMDQLPDIAEELANGPRPICLKSCGSPNV